MPTTKTSNLSLSYIFADEYYHYIHRVNADYGII